MRIKKAVIPVAGLGTRFLPFTKSVPKEMLPVVDIPAIQFIVEEAIASGIREILLVTSKEKESIARYFKRNKKLEALLKKSKKMKPLADLKSVPVNFRIKTVIQKKPKGLGDAILHAERFARGGDFAVFLPDDIIFSGKPAIKQMMDAAQKYKKPVIGLERVEKKLVSSYGIVKPVKLSKRAFLIKDLAEKPSPKKAFSNLAIVGRYILPSSVFGYIRKTRPGAIGEIQLTDALHMLMKKEGLLGYEFDGDRCDTGNKEGYMITILKYASKKFGANRKIRAQARKSFNL